jgi:hypothetical protein
VTRRIPSSTWLKSIHGADGGDLIIGAANDLRLLTVSGRHVYVHHTHTAINGIYSGVPAPEQNNHLSRFDN